MQIEAKVRLLNNDTGLKGVADVIFDKAFIVKGVFIRDGEKGLFLNYPSYKNGDEYKVHCHPITAECRQKVIDTVLTAYEQKLSETQAKEQSHGKKEQKKASGSKAQTHADTQTPKTSAATQTQKTGMSMEM